jgi:hypothetical protein
MLLPTSSGHRRLVLLCASCCVPLLFILTLAFLSSRDAGTGSFLPELPKSHLGDHVPLNLVRPTATPELTEQGPNLGHTVDNWEFDVNLDGGDYGLSDERCDAAFPDYYHEIERAVAWRKEQDLPNIEESQMDISWRNSEIMRLMIFDRQVSL